MKELIQAQRELIEAEYNELRELKDKYAGTPNGRDWSLKFQVVRDLRAKIAQFEQSATTKMLGEWQLCPKCLGMGTMPNPYPSTSAGVFSVTCNVCHGAKVLIKPLIPTASKVSYTEEQILDAWEYGASERLPLSQDKKERLFKILKPLSQK